MSKKLISEQEKKEILKKYDLNEDFSLDDLLKKLSNQFSSLMSGKSNPLKGITNKLKDITSPTTPKKSKIGKIKIKGNFDGTQRNNIELLVDKMEENGIVDPYAQIGILSVINKESGFKPKNEVSYENTPNERIRKIFGQRVKGLSDAELTSLKSDPKRFFNTVYGKIIGNKGTDDGWFYRGRGFNGLTGMANYKKYGELIGMDDDLVENPELVNDPEIAADIAIKFFTKNKSASSFPSFDSKEDAAEYFANLNAGGSAVFSKKAVEMTKNFDVE